MKGIKSLSNIDKLTKLLSFIFKNDLIHSHHWNGFVIKNKKLCKAKWIESEIDLDSGTYEYIPATDEKDVSDNLIARAEEVYGKYMLELEEKEKIDKFVRELYETDTFSI